MQLLSTCRMSSMVRDAEKYKAVSGGQAEYQLHHLKTWSAPEPWVPHRTQRSPESAMGIFWRREISEGWLSPQTGSRRSWDPGWILKDGFVEKECESKVQRATSPASPLMCMGRRKKSVLCAGWDGSCGCTKKSRQRSRDLSDLSQPLLEGKEQWGVLIHCISIKRPREIE